MRRSMLLAASCLVMPALASAAHAGEIFVNPPVQIDGPYTYDFAQAGFGFYATTAGTKQVNRLGFYDDGNDGLIVSHEVGLYNWNGASYTLIAKATVPAGTAAPLEGGYRWVDIPALTLSDTTQGSDYYFLAASYGSDVIYEGSGSVTVLDPSFGTLTGNGYSNPNPFGSVGSTATGGTVGYQWAGANIGFAVVPEPASLALLVGGAALVLRRRV